MISHGKLLRFLCASGFTLEEAAAVFEWLLADAVDRFGEWVRDVIVEWLDVSE